MGQNKGSNAWGNGFIQEWALKIKIWYSSTVSIKGMAFEKIHPAMQQFFFYSIILLAPCSHRTSRCFFAHVGSEFSTSQPYWQALNALPRPVRKKKRHSGLFMRGLGKEKTAGGCFRCASSPSLRGRTHYKDNTPHTCRLTWSAVESRARSRWIIPGSTSIMKTVFSMNHLSDDFGMSHTTTDTLKQVFFNCLKAFTEKSQLWFDYSTTI